MKSKTNLTNAVVGSIVLFDNGYHGIVIASEDMRVKVSIPLWSCRSVMLNVWVDRITGIEYSFARLHGTKAVIAEKKAVDTIIDKAINKQKAVAISDISLVKAKDYSIHKVEKGRYQVHIIDSLNKSQILDKHFKSITAAQEWCAIHIKTA